MALLYNKSGTLQAQPSPADISASSTVARRASLVKRALEVREACKKVLKPVGLLCPDNVSQTTGLCVQKDTSGIAKKLEAAWREIH